MLTLGFNEFIRNFKKNFLVIIQIVAAYVVAIFTISSFEEQYKLIDGMSDFFDDIGIILYSRPWSTDEFVKRDELDDILTGVENIEYILKMSLMDNVFNKDGATMENIQISAYNNRLNSYVPELLKGKWVEDVESEAGIINAVVSNNLPFSIDVGDIIEYAGYNIKIVGIVSTKEMLYGEYNNYGGDETSYLSYYSSLAEKNTDDEQEYRFIVSYNDFCKKFDLDVNSSSVWGNLITIDFDDNITEQEYDLNISELNKRYGYEMNVDMFNTEQIYEYSWKLIEIKIMPMVMLFIVICIVLLFSLIISGAINVLYEKKNYGIYFICGNNWNNTFMFSMFSWSILSVTALIISGCICLLVKICDSSNMLSLSFSIIHISGIVIITCLFIIICTLVPYIMLRKMQPVTILKENEK